MSDPAFTITLADLKRLSDAVCELDAFKPARDVRLVELVNDCHGIIIRTLGNQVGQVYAPDDSADEPSNAFEKAVADGRTLKSTVADLLKAAS